ncbi:hypothetical protein HOP62_16025 [Halomonas sp. MCCC 1A17488]|uniref:Uncharacterized protein n=1 Tax=Billgrantia sulfidoxydans TaxID=2733484 RepID=A0ABX7W7F6_9GAMM|nr:MULTISPECIES: hypothetical protein [Halomonas]MCE8017585.1 hypothetical protein [Halomonas sp. MCCC 1A17488]MCG3240918.1 hypothetical protein [Halomonas sp. MCCC 1A17488]QPP48789.1 hypothetical protein I4484_16475 [Halomonas sp. SS10-MC5]QTP56125.1 hypothetical protein HNO51_16400 [Halomonas sulfidoxydans]
MIRKLFVALVLMAFISPAWASQCPMLMSEIDDALEDDAKVSQLSEDDLARVRELREQGEQYHNDGDHAQSEEALNEAKELLGI